MQDKKDLTQGAILPHIISLSLPIIGSSFIQMAYNMADIFWMGKVGSEYVTAIGSAGYILWFSVALIFMIKIGVEVGIAQAIGKKNINKIKDYTQDGLRMTLIGALILMCFCIFVGKYLLQLFTFENSHIFQSSVNYLTIFSLAFPFFMISFIFSGIYIGMGDSKTPFYINSMGLILNIVLDPLLILGIGPFPPMKAEGAALASLIAQALVFALFLIFFIRKKKDLLVDFTFRKFNDIQVVKHILKLGFPVSLQTTLFAMFAFVVAQIVSTWGAEPVAMISIGANIEAVSWMTASGFATALGAFVGQNFGAKQYGRIIKGFIVTTSISVCLGFVAALVFFFFPREVVGAFNNEAIILDIGVRYMRIIAIAQVFMCLEICSTGVFNGIGKTQPPAYIGIIFNAMRVLGVFVLAKYTNLGVDGAWWSISISSVLKGIVLLVWLLFVLKSLNKLEPTQENFGSLFIRFIPARIRHQIFDNRTK